MLALILVTAGHLACGLSEEKEPEVDVSHAEQAAATLRWAGLAWGTSKDDVPYSAAISGSNAYLAGSMIKDLNLSLGFFELELKDARHQFRVTKHPLGSDGAWTDNIQGECIERLFSTSLNDYIEFTHGERITADPAGNLYAVGHVRCGKAELKSAGSTRHVHGDLDGDGFVVKLAGADLRPMWVEEQKGGGEEKTEAVIADNSYVWVAGHFNSSHLWLRGATRLANRGGFDVFVTRYGADGTWTGNVIGIGGSADDGKPSLAKDAAGSIYITGYFRSTDLAVYKRDNNGSTQLMASIPKPSGGSDIFVVKLSPDLSSVQWVTAFGSGGDDRSRGLAVRGGDVYVGGFYAGTMTFPGCCTMASAGSRDGFGALLDNTTGKILGGVRVGGSGQDEVSDLVVVPNTGRIYLTGYFTGSMTVGPYRLSSAGNRDAFVIEVDRYGNIYGAASAGGTARDEATTLAAGNDVVVVAGTFDSNPFYAGRPIYKQGTRLDAFVVRLDHDAARMNPGDELHPGMALVSKDGRFTFVYQHDGNLVLYQGSTPLWSSRTAGTSPGRAVMQTDGNLVVYDAGGVARWDSRTWGNPGSYLIVQSDGNVVIYRTTGQPIWATNTCCR
jgi:hypothetical protein